MRLSRSATLSSQEGAADRRRYPRRVIPGIEATLRSPGDVKVFDLSLTGMAAEVAQQMRPGEHCFLELRHRQDRAVVETVVKWSSTKKVGREIDLLMPKFLAGMSFIDIDREGVGGIWDCILTEAEA